MYCAECETELKRDTVFKKSNCPLCGAVMATTDRQSQTSD